MRIFFNDDRIVLSSYTSVHTHLAYGDVPSLDFDADRITIEDESTYQELENDSKDIEIEKTIDGLNCHFVIISDFSDGDGYAYPSVYFDEKDLEKDNSMLLSNGQIQEIVDTIDGMYNSLQQY